MATDKTTFNGTLGAALVEIQKELKAPKNLYNSFGGYNYRNAESILEAVKPLLHIYGCYVTLSDTIEEIGGRVYVKATASISKGTESLSVTAYAREAEAKKGMDDAQITGAASSYARKYALNGLFLLDDTKDADSNEYHEETSAPKTKAQPKKAATAAPAPAETPTAPAVFICEDCKKPIQPRGLASAEAIARKSKSDFGRCLCVACAQAEKERIEQALPFPIPDLGV
jgi:hypothetical protein